MKENDLSMLVEVVWDKVDRVYALSHAKALVAFVAKRAMDTVLPNGIIPVALFCSSMKKWSNKD